MAGKKEAQKTLSFRLNVSKEDERKLYEAIISHNRGNVDDPYGSSGSYIKAALKNYYDEEQMLQQKGEFEQKMQLYIQKQAEVQRELFLQALADHDHNMVAMVVEAVAGAMNSTRVLGHIPNASVVETNDRVMQNQNVENNTKTASSSTKFNYSVNSEQEVLTESMPEEAFSYVRDL